MAITAVWLLSHSASMARARRTAQPVLSFREDGVAFSNTSSSKAKERKVRGLMPLWLYTSVAVLLEGSLDLSCPDYYSLGTST